MQRLLAHREQAIPSLRFVRPDAPARIEAVYERMIGKKASERYQSVSELIADLEQQNLPAVPTRIFLPRASVANVDQNRRDQRHRI